MILGGQVLWIIFWRGQYEITVNLLEDLWNRNLINVFVSPLKFSEWIGALVIHGILKAFLSFVFAIGLAFMLYRMNIFLLGFYLVPFMLLLIMLGWAVGFFVAAVILRFGTRVQNLAWTFGGLLGPFSAIYYPVSILPNWAQSIAYLLPSSYVFEGMRKVIHNGYLDTHLLLAGFVLNVIYLFLSLLFLSRSFKKVLEKGLVKVY
jgi:ABC-2 type transport system permease protein